MTAISLERVRTDVVAVVLNWNGWQDTLECLESLRGARLAPGRIVVCDNGSIDGSLERIAQWANEAGVSCETLISASLPLDPARVPDARLVLLANEENRGFAAGVNVGIRFALERLDARYVWILNNDAIAGPLALEAMLSTAKSHPQAGMIACALLRYDRPNVLQALGGGYIVPWICHDTQLASGQALATFPSQPVKLDHLVGASMLVRAEAIRDVGCMDESYFLYREETDWCIAMRRRGWELYCSPNARVWHKQSRSVGFKSPMHDYYAVRNMLRLVRKFYPASLPTAFAYYALRSLVPKVARLQFARAGAVVRALHDFVRGIDGRPVYHTDRRVLDQYVPVEKLSELAQLPAPVAAGRTDAAVSAGVGAALLAVFAFLAIALSGVPTHGMSAASKPGLGNRAAESIVVLDAIDGIRHNGFRGVANDSVAADLPGAQPRRQPAAPAGASVRNPQSEPGAGCEVRIAGAAGQSDACGARNVSGNSEAVGARRGGGGVEPGAASEGQYDDVGLGNQPGRPAPDTRARSGRDSGHWQSAGRPRQLRAHGAAGKPH